MKNKFIPLVLAAFMMSAAFSEAAIRVVTTTQDLAAIAREVGGKHVKVTALAKGYQDPHFVDAKPSYLLKLKRADLFMQVGLELEAAWAPALLTGARNKKILPSSPGFLDASQGCEILQKQSGPVDRSQGDIHPFGNPHYWLDAKNGAIIASSIMNKLKEIDPDHAGDYEANLERFEKELAKKNKEWKKLSSALKGAKVVTYHNSWPNFAKRFGLQVVNFVEPKPGVPPSPVHVKSLTQQMKKEGIALILVEPYFNLKLSKKIASQAGAQVLVLAPSVGGEKSIRTYFDLFDYNLNKIKKALAKSRNTRKDN